MASASLPVSLKRGTLTIEVRDPETADYVKSGRRELLKSVNAVIGSGAVLRIRWVESPRRYPHVMRDRVPEADDEIRELAGVIQDDDLRERFIRLLSFRRERRGKL